MVLSRSYSIFLTAVLSVISLASVGASPVVSRIIGGHSAIRGQFPYQVSFYHRKGFNDCGGSILSKNWILTAAHCVEWINTSDYKISVGSIYPGNGTMYSIGKVIIHKEYDRYDLINDIALVKTKTPIVMSRAVKPIPLHPRHVGANVTVVASGMGYTWMNMTDNVQVLQFTALKTISNEDCATEWNSVLAITDGILCTFTQRGNGMCKGDSGGPLALNGKLVGVVSFGAPCAKGYPDGFTRVSKYLDWIKENMK